MSADRLIRTLEGLGFQVIREKRSHVRLHHEGPPVRTVTLPLHNPLKTGTLHGIIADVALVRSTTVDSLAELL